MPMSMMGRPQYMDPNFDPFGRRKFDNEGNDIPEPNRLMRTSARKGTTNREMRPMFEAIGRI